MKYLAILLSFITFLSSCAKEEISPNEYSPLLWKESIENSGIVKEYNYDASKRFTGMKVTQAGLITFESRVLKYSPKNKPSEVLETDIKLNKQRKLLYSYDDLGRISSCTSSDSISPNNYTLINTNTYTYEGNKIIIMINFAVGTTFRQEFLLDSNGNITSQDYYDQKGIKYFEYVYENYDNKPNPYLSSSSAFSGNIFSKNNYQSYTSHNITDGTKTIISTQYSYNDQNQVEKLMTSNGLIINYSYIK
jgi:hypothetical protein